VPLQRVLARWARVNIVDQVRFKELMESWGAKALVLENPPKNIDFKTLSGDASAEFGITLINVFAADEPVEVVVEAARQLPHVKFYITGSKNRAKRSLLDNAPENVIFTDYLHGDDYWNRLYASRAVMTLTTHAYSLVAGAQDGVAVQKPLILSNQPTLTAHFTKGTVFVENTVESIVNGVRELEQNEQKLIAEVTDLGKEQANKWESSFQELLAIIAAI
jgi:glycosyltransferase involved in cell wall biosynthesis